ncbi:hypothetical protein Q5H93_17845 [Hymenobacter sp. ASUV-10]|uniref:Uncharacterized protein n=1 Tax=Hymenobacter aranciens TaxID=3063996 RepID=A0ABT9BJA1_9BACT|nr:hypothetical protein [Hymenobacter sp. ASUV-10]MDO7876613.1 hypothetical protein [Hymenobacter sp. ASUV-10]
MADEQPLNRIYGGSDDDMRQRQRTMRQHYLDNADTFASFNPEVFTDDYAAKWEAAQEAAETADSATVRAGTLKEDTQEVKAEMEKARKLVQRLFYTVGQAWPKNVGRLNQYGKNRYERDRDSHDGMITLLDLAHDAASRPADALQLAKYGWKDTDTKDLDAQGEALTTANTTQESQKGTGVEQGQGYIGQQNALYRFGQQASLGSKTLFADDFAKRQLFDLSPPDGDDDEDHELTVQPGRQKSVLFTTPLDGVAGLRLLLSKPRPGMQAEVGRVRQADQTPSEVVALVPEQRSRDVLAADLGPAGQYLVVRNTGAHPVRVVLRVLED